MIRLFATLIVAGALLIGLLVLSGLFDPRPQGVLLWQQDRSVINIAANSEEIRFLTSYPIGSDISLNLSSKVADGELDIGYGLALSSEDDTVVIAVSPLGYTAIWETETGMKPQENNFILPWQTWPHIRTGSQENEIQVSTAKNVLTARINHELLWQGPVQNRYDKINLYGVSFGDEALIEVRSIALYVE